MRRSFLRRNVEGNIKKTNKKTRKKKKKKEEQKNVSLAWQDVCSTAWAGPIESLIVCFIDLVIFLNLQAQAQFLDQSGGYYFSMRARRLRVCVCIHVCVRASVSD